MWQKFVIGLAKVATSVVRLVGYNGTALPGLVVERLSPNLLTQLSGKLRLGVIVVTGTNGKTTTAKIMRHLLEARGFKVLANRSGSNFTRGIIASFIQHAELSGNLPYDLAVLEIDEAYTPQLARQLRPRQIVVLNVMRDQLDRYGEIDHTARLIGSALEYCGGAVLNADDPPVASLKSYAPIGSDITYFGASSRIRRLLPSDDELMDRSTVKAANTKAGVVLSDIKADNDSTQLAIKVAGQTHSTDFNLEGVHNALNATAAVASLHQLLGAKAKDINRLASVKPAFGRGERLTIDGVPIHLALIKNPGGFNQNVRSFVKPRVGLFLIAINDRYADGRDVSWLWDVDLSTLPKDGKYVVSGIRAYDMALRLKYEGIDKIDVETNLSRALHSAISQITADTELLVLPTYTAMLDLRRLIGKQAKAQEIWR